MDYPYKDKTYWLSEAEIRLLNYLVETQEDDPDIGQITDECNITAAEYYNAAGRTDFQKLLKEITKDVLQIKMPNVVKATYKNAVNNPKGSVDRKLLLEMSKYHEQSNQNNNQNNSLTLNFNGDTPMDKILSRLAGLKPETQLPNNGKSTAETLVAENE